MTQEEKVKNHMTQFHKVLFYLSDVLTDLTPEECNITEINMNLRQIQSETGELRWYASQSITEKTDKGT